MGIGPGGGLGGLVPAKSRRGFELCIGASTHAGVIVAVGPSSSILKVKSVYRVGLGAGLSFWLISLSKSQLTKGDQSTSS
jgi:hypothetical protein